MPSGPTKISREDIRRTMTQAAATWVKYTNIVFQEIFSGKPSFSSLSDNNGLIPSVAMCCIKLLMLLKISQKLPYLTTSETFMFLIKKINKQGRVSLVRNRGILGSKPTPAE